jgi:hypothetical protein
MDAEYLVQHELYTEQIKSWHLTGEFQREAEGRFVVVRSACPPGWFRNCATPWRGTLKMAEKWKLAQYDILSYCLRDLQQPLRIKAFQGVNRIIRIAANGPVPKNFATHAARAVVVEEDVLPVTEHYEQGHQLVHVVFLLVCLFVCLFVCLLYCEMIGTTS